MDACDSNCPNPWPPEAQARPLPGLPDTLRVMSRGWLSSNQVVFTTDGCDTAVVDTGHVREVQTTLALTAHALQGLPLQRIVNTHLHSDHAGGNAALQAAYPGVRVSIPPGLAEAVQRWDEAALSYRDTDQTCPRFLHDDTLPLQGHVQLGGWPWQVLPADGHDRHMVMLWCEPLRVLISADALWRQGFGVLFPELAGEPGAFEAQWATLDTVERLRPRWVIPGHGDPFCTVGEALAGARSRLQWLAEDPSRHAQVALKGLVAFGLMERGEMSLAAVTRLIGQGLMAQPGFARCFDEPAQTLAERVMAQLVRAGVAREIGPETWGTVDARP